MIKVAGAPCDVWVSMKKAVKKEVSKKFPVPRWL